MITQTSIHAKIDDSTLTWLRNVAYKEGVPLNRALNKACNLYIRYKEAGWRLDNTSEFNDFYDQLHKYHIHDGRF